ncbi:MAG: Fic family protein [Candidatus Thermoplasmatota archaeon]|nr:Fic family protein [Candidatus Thermoplasmatota archaeon]
MGSLDPAYLDSIRLSPDQVSVLRSLGSYQGMFRSFEDQDPEMLEELRKLAKIESIGSSNRLEGIIVEHGRLEEIALSPSVPVGRSESEVAGYRDALDLIHGSFGKIAPDTASIRELHEIVYSYTPVKGGAWKTSENYIIERVGDRTHIRFRPVKAKDTPEAMENLIREFEIVSSMGYDPLLTVPLFMLDLLCIHPFSDGNGRVARLVTLLLLYREGYHVGRYISLERVVEQTKERYYRSLQLSSQGWHDREHDTMPWLSYFWMVLLKAYKEIEERANRMLKGKGSKTIAVRRAVMSLPEPFSLSEVKEECPGVSHDMVRHVLKLLKQEGSIFATSRGRGARWRRYITDTDDSTQSH